MQVQEIGLPIKDIIDLPTDEFSILLSRHKLSEEQMTFCRDVRRRGRNKEACQKYRKRKQMETDVAKIRGRKAKLVTNPGKMLQKKAKFASNPISIPAKQSNNPWNSTTKPDCIKENVTVRKIDSGSSSSYNQLDEKRKDHVSVNAYSKISIGKSKATIDQNQFKKSNGTGKPEQKKTADYQNKPVKRTEKDSLNAVRQTKNLPDQQKESPFVSKRFENIKTNMAAPKYPSKAEPNRHLQRRSSQTNTKDDNQDKPPGRNLTNQVRFTNGVQLKKRGESLLQTRPEFVNIQKESKKDSSKKVQQQQTNHIPSPNIISTSKSIPKNVHAGGALKTNETNAGNAYHKNVVSNSKNEKSKVRDTRKSNLNPKQKAHLTCSPVKQVSKSYQSLKKNNPHKRNRCEEDLSDKGLFLAKRNCSTNNIRGQTFVFM